MNFPKKCPAWYVLQVQFTVHCLWELLFLFFFYILPLLEATKECMHPKGKTVIRHEKGSLI